MHWITELLSNRVFLATVLSWIFGQGSKILVLAVRGRLTRERLTGGGGMPSGHSATVTGLAMSCGLVEGFDSSVFAVALFFAILAIYDAKGVRYETGEQGKVLNRMADRDEKEGKEPLYRRRFPEMMGHTTPEIVVGILIGLAVSVIFCALTA